MSARRRLSLLRALRRIRWPRLSLRRLSLRRIPWRKIPLRPHTRHGAGALAIVLLATLWFTSSDEARAGVDTWSRRDILDAIRWVESRDVPDREVPDGDDGRAIGPYQIHQVYWLDAHSYDDRLGGDYQDCRRRAYAERVIDAYMRRYAADAWRDGHGEHIARVHNGGPKGHEKRATDKYWKRVRARLPAPQ